MLKVEKHKLGMAPRNICEDKGENRPRGSQSLLDLSLVGRFKKKKKKKEVSDVVKRAGKLSAFCYSPTRGRI